ncbi:MAG: GNAT family N-acetyltransferase [Clostridia bacterium]|nr:GNAT family N-acetyltransferase [Clostridia bacterium]MDD4375817.1 GNAT family N-acetyltransferase [Clostridia bacterium]
MKIIFASKLLDEERIEFLNIITKAYEVTDYICNDYPKHFSWYWEKTVPAIFKGTRDVITCTVHGKIAGVVFLKKEDSEKKICTFLVLEEFRNQGIATKLMEASFEFLGTTKPLITLADYKLEMFSHIIKKHDWVQTQILPKGFYNDKYTELVFNGSIE